jgi:hypothetical protein
MIIFIVVVDKAERSEAVGCVVVISASSSDSEDKLRLYCGRHRNQPIMFCAALVLSLFLDGARNNPSCSSLH